MDHDYGHCAIRIVDADRHLDITIELIPGDAGLKAPLGRKKIYWSAPTDKKAKAYDPKGWVQIATPDGMTDQQFDDALMKAAGIETQEQTGDPYWFGGETNSNHFVYQVVKSAGGQVPGSPAKRFPKGAPGLCGGSGMDTGTDCKP